MFRLVPVNFSSYCDLQDARMVGYVVTVLNHYVDDVRTRI